MNYQTSELITISLRNKNSKRFKRKASDIKITICRFKKKSAEAKLFQSFQRFLFSQLSKTRVFAIPLRMR